MTGDLAPFSYLVLKYSLSRDEHSSLFSRGMSDELKPVLYDWPQESVPVQQGKNTGSKIKFANKLNKK